MWLIDMFTTRNVAPIDRLIRVLPTVAVAWLSWGGAIGGWLAVGLALPALMLLVTTFTGSCSVYYTFGLSSLRRN
jgi:hypothetical protein